MLCVPEMKIALVHIQRKLKFNVGPCGTYESELDFDLVPSFPGYEIAQRLIFPWCLYSVFPFSFFLFCFGFLHYCHCKTTPLQEDIITLTSGVISHYILLLPLSSRASQTSGPRVQFIHHSWLFNCRNISLDFSQRRYFGLFKGIHLLCTLISTHWFYFLVGWYWWI